MNCPQGHDTQASDYCDVCGEAMPARPDTNPGYDDAPAGTASPSPADPAASGAPDDATSAADPVCPNCSAPHNAEALFCEACGYDYTTGSMPRQLEEPAPAEAVASPGAPDINTSASLTQPWVAEVWIDPQWYASQESPDALPSAGPPTTIPLRNASLLIGRVSQSRGIHPDIDCGNDNGVSRRHAQLTSDGSRWFVEDLQSSNGTYVGESVGSLPGEPIAVGRKREVAPDERIYVGSWTRIVLREADASELLGPDAP